MKKKFSKTISAFLSAFLLLAAGCGGTSPDSSDSSGGGISSGSGGSGEVTFDTYGSYWFPQHDYKTMPVGAYNSVPSASYGYAKNFLVDEEIFRAYAEAGVNMMMGLTDFVGANQADVAVALDFCYDYNLAYLLAYQGADKVGSESNVRSTLATVMHHENFAGIMLSDEPGRVMYEDLAESRSIFESVLADTSEKLYHVNLFPTYATEKQLWFRSYTDEDVLPVESYTYEQYLNDFMDMYDPQVLSYDFYPIQGSFPELMGGYFENMSVIRKAALEANIPFWVYIQTCSFSSGQRISTEADLMWNVNTCLAYGAKGIQYFCGVNPQGNFTGSMFDVNGNRTEMYDLVKKADEMIAAVDEVLMCSRSEGVIVEGIMPLLNGTDRMTLPESDRLQSYRQLTGAEANHALIGCFDYDGKTALYVVNNAIAADEEAGTAAEDEVTLRFTENVSGYTLDAAGKKDFSGNALTLPLGAGEAMLVVIG